MCTHKLFNESKKKINKIPFYADILLNNRLCVYMLYIRYKIHYLNINENNEVKNRMKNEMLTELAI